MTERSQTTLADYLRTLRRYRLFIALVAIACAGAGLLYSVLQTPSYDATASLSVQNPAQDLNVVGGVGTTNQTPLQLASAHAPQVTRTVVVHRVRKNLKSKQGPAQLRSLVDVAVDPNSYLVNITARSSNAAKSARIANAFAQADAKLSNAEARRNYRAAADRLSTKIKHLKTARTVGTIAIYTDRLSSLQALSSVATPVKVSDQAEVPSSPTSPQPIRNTVGGGIFGIFLGVLLALGRQRLDRKLRGAADVERAFELPIATSLRPEAFGHTGSVRDAEIHGSPLDPIDAESIRRLRENVRYLAVDKDLRTIAVTSAIPEEGKSTVAACLAMASAATGTPTLLVECDLRKPVLAKRLGISEAPGLSDFLAGHAPPKDTLQLVPVPAPVPANGSGPTSLVCITAGSRPPRPADLLSSQRFAEFLAQVSQAYAQVIIDCPPLLPVADALEIVPHVAGVLLCVRLNRATVDQARSAREALRRLPERPVGLVLTDFKPTGTDAYYGEYYYGREEAVSKAREGARPVAVEPRDRNVGIATVAPDRANAGRGAS